MQREFLQEKSLNQMQGNAEKSFNIDLSAKSRLIPYSTAAGMLGLNDLYVEERNACENYRMLFTVNPICTNVIYNAVTEPVYKEGSDDTINLVQDEIQRTGEAFSSIFKNGTLNTSGDSVDRIFAIRDTEISHKDIGDFVYHCGYDIFNNHMLRTEEFEHVSMADNEVNKDVFNTIFDYAIDCHGKEVKRVVNESSGPVTGSTLDNQRENIRLYQIDSIKTMNTAFYDGLRLVDGWYGFYNTGYINIQNAKLNQNQDNPEGIDIFINRVLNNEIPCGFVDMYPDRTLYSFIPKVNRYRKRIERNWDCSIVYPYKNDYELFSTINENEIDAIKIIGSKIIYNNVGDRMIQFHSLLRNTLKPGDTIRIFYKERLASSDLMQRFSVPVTIVSTGDEKGHDLARYFTVKYFDIDSFCDINSDNKLVSKDSIDDSQPLGIEISFWYKKIENGYDNKYYFRKFKKLFNFFYTEHVPGEGEDMSEYVEVKKLPEFVNEDSRKKIKYNNSFFDLTKKELSYTQNKIAFAENIYGDRVAQVIFNDDICISGIKDNLGRPLSSVYLASVKTNRGHKEWYENGETSNDTIEYSHCFGDITSGLDLPMEDNSTEYNVRKLHNVFIDDCEEQGTYLNGLKKIMENAPTGTYNGTPKPIENNLTIDGEDGEFYGDVVEFSKTNFTETVIEKVYHRFNTAQRELLKNQKYYDINYDELVGDIYDVEKLNE